MDFRPDSSYTNRAHQAEERARSLMQDVLDREEWIRNNLASVDIDPWTMRFVVSGSIPEGAVITRRNEAIRACCLTRRYDIQRGYHEELHKVEKHIDAMLHLAESLEESWDVATHASERLSDAGAYDVVTLERERERQNDAAETKRQREEKVRKFRQKAESTAADVWDADHDTLEKLPPLSSSLKDIAAKFRLRGSEEKPREIRWTTAHNLHREPPLSEDWYSSDLAA